MTNPTALVTGGSSGIGRAIAARLAEDGFQVTITGRNAEALAEAAASHENIEATQADVTSSDDIGRVLSGIQEKYGRLDVLVNNAGVGTPLPLEHVDLGHYDHVFGVNVRGLIDTTRQALPLLKSSKGNVVNISSIVGNRPMPQFSVYSASKAAVTSLSRAWAKELAADGVRVNIVSPGPIETPIFGKMGMPAEEIEAMGEMIQQQVPLGRFGQPEEVAATVAYLASGQASYVTGAEFSVDGGMNA